MIYYLIFVLLLFLFSFPSHDGQQSGLFSDGQRVVIASNLTVNGVDILQQINDIQNRLNRVKMTVSITTITSNSQYVPSPNTQYVVVECVGGGGGGGGVGVSTGGGGGLIAAAGGGGGGGYSKRTVDVATLLGGGAYASITVGIGGSPGVGIASSGTFGTSTQIVSNQGNGAILAQGNGGGGGFSSTGQAACLGSSQAAGGSGAYGDINIPGRDGSDGFGGQWSSGGGYGVAGVGGSSFLGSGTTAPGPLVPNQNTPGSAGQSFGAGGSGASLSNTNGAQNGGHGANGVVIISEFILLL